MAAPYFYTDLAALQAATRTSGIDADLPDELAILNGALEAAQVTLYQKVGTTELTRLQAVTEVCPPTSDDEAKRLVLKQVERDLFLAELACRLPVMFQDSEKQWEEFQTKVTLFASMPWSEIMEFRKKLLLGVDSNLNLIGIESDDYSIGIMVLGCPTPPVHALGQVSPLTSYRYGYYDVALTGAGGLWRKYQ